MQEGSRRRTVDPCSLQLILLWPPGSLHCIFPNKKIKIQARGEYTSRRIICQLVGR
jgi:hypothetical protein